jgi:hypothetical protein
MNPKVLPTVKNIRNIIAKHEKFHPIIAKLHQNMKIIN